MMLFLRQNGEEWQHSLSMRPLT
ncbi:hypothetical protein GQ600_12267 [Phytophthora cactorum]|nr:hypothetical protein GQ600_12267 [Phytophthora cactorum]